MGNGRPLAQKVECLDTPLALQDFSWSSMHEICSVILNLFLFTLEYIYNVTYNRYMQLTIGSIIRVYYRVV